MAENTEVTSGEETRFSSYTRRDEVSKAIAQLERCTFRLRLMSHLISVVFFGSALMLMIMGFFRVNKGLIYHNVNVFWLETAVASAPLFGVFLLWFWDRWVVGG